MHRILFVCTGNTCRSVIAEYLARHRLDSNSVSCESAGIRLVASEDARNAIQTLDFNFKIDASRHVPREIGTVDLSRFDVIVAIALPRKYSGVSNSKRKGRIGPSFGPMEDCGSLWR
jgi:protein-tyrosine-phosphatase